MRARSARNTFLTLRCFVCSSTPLAASVASGGALPAGTGGQEIQTREVLYVGVELKGVS